MSPKLRIQPLRVHVPQTRRVVQARREQPPPVLRESYGEDGALQRVISSVLHAYIASRRINSKPLKTSRSSKTLTRTLEEEIRNQTPEVQIPTSCTVLSKNISPSSVHTLKTESNDAIASSVPSLLQWSAVRSALGSASMSASAVSSIFTFAFPFSIFTFGFPFSRLTELELRGKRRRGGPGARAKAGEVMAGG
jgi:hypothetical protein